MLLHGTLSAIHINIWRPKVTIFKYWVQAVRIRVLLMIQPDRSSWILPSNSWTMHILEKFLWQSHIGWGGPLLWLFDHSLSPVYLLWRSFCSFVQNVRTIRQIPRAWAFSCMKRLSLRRIKIWRVLLVLGFAPALLVASHSAALPWSLNCTRF